MRIRKPEFFVLPLLLAAVSGVPIGTALAGDTRFSEVRTVCQHCHGLDGTHGVVVSGHRKTYLVEQLRAFRSGTRHNEPMNIIAKSLTDTDIENLPQWNSSIKVIAVMPK